MFVPFLGGTGVWVLGGIVACCWMVSKLCVMNPSYFCWTHDNSCVHNVHDVQSWEKRIDSEYLTDPCLRKNILFSLLLLGLSSLSMVPDSRNAE